MKTPFTRALLVTAYLAAPLGMASLSACNTVEGAGKDVSATGDAVTDSARATKREITR